MSYRGDMIGKSPVAAMAACLLLGLSVPAQAATPEEECLLGSDRDPFQDYLPFTRSIGVAGVVAGSLADSAVAAGVPASAMLDALKAFATTIDLNRDVSDGDRFYVRYEQMFTLAGAAIGVGRVLWSELQLGGKRTVGIYRFRPTKGPEEFWTDKAQGTADPQLRLPVEIVTISSAFGWRVDPFDQPAMRGMGLGPLRTPRPPAPPQASPLLQHVNTATPLGQKLGLAPDAYSGAFGAYAARSRSGGGTFAMHEGVDLVAPIGTPIHAAGDGIVKGAEPKGRYGNWIEIEHPGKLGTVYGHLMGFAPGIEPGAEVHKGDVIGYVGTTGRTTGPHVHFELLVNGHPTNPVVHSAIRPPHLAGADLVAFRKVVAEDHVVRQLEDKVR